MLPITRNLVPLGRLTRRPFFRVVSPQGTRLPHENRGRQSGSNPGDRCDLHAAARTSSPAIPIPRAEMLSHAAREWRQRTPRSDFRRSPWSSDEAGCALLRVSLCVHRRR